MIRLANMLMIPEQRDGCQSFSADQARGEATTRQTERQNIHSHQRRAPIPKLDSPHGGGPSLRLPPMFPWLYWVEASPRSLFIGMGMEAAALLSTYNRIRTRPGVQKTMHSQKNLEELLLIGYNVQ